MNFKNGKLSFLALFVISLFLVVLNISFYPKNIISWDVFGYYLYLPMNFIYDNWGLQDTGILHQIVEQYQSSSTLYQAYRTETGFWVMRYPMGMSILYSPFFFIGDFLTRFTEYPRDGYSPPYQMAILSSGMFYSIVGFYFLRKTLLRYFTDIVSALCLILIYLGTNYFMHSSFYGTNAMSHNYLFSLYAIVIWYTIRWHETFRAKYLVLLALFCGLTIIARPSEMVCLFIPFFWEVGTHYSFVAKIKLFLQKKKHTLLFFAILFVAAMPQFIYWKIVSGKFLFNSYSDNPGEGLELLHPYIMNVLFSFRKGWLVYTPLMILALIGIYTAFKTKKEYAYATLIYFCINFYIVASWSCWWYAESFGQRSLIPSYAILALPLGALLSVLLKPSRKWLAGFTLTVLVLFAGLNVFQTWQYLHDVIHSSRMTKEAYFAVFGKTETPPDFEKMLVMARNGGPVEINEADHSKTKEWIEEFDTIPHASKEMAFSGAVSMKMDSVAIYSPTIKRAYSELTEKDYAKLKVSMQVFCSTEIKNNPGSIVISFEHKQRPYGYSAMDIEKFNIEPNKWTEVSVNYLTPIIRTPDDTLKVYYWHRGKMPLFIDKLKVEVWESKKD